MPIAPKIRNRIGNKEKYVFEMLFSHAVMFFDNFKTINPPLNIIDKSIIISITNLFFVIFGFQLVSRQIITVGRNTVCEPIRRPSDVALTLVDIHNGPAAYEEVRSG